MWTMLCQALTSKMPSTASRSMASPVAKLAL